MVKKVTTEAKKYGHNSLNPYPTDLSEPCNILLGKVSGEDVDISCCIHAAYQVAGVALGRLYPDEDTGAPKMLGTTPVACPSDEEAKKLLTNAKSMHGSLSDLILKQLLAFAQAKLMEWLAGILKK